MAIGMPRPVGSKYCGGVEVEGVEADLGGLLDDRPGGLLALVPLGGGRADHVGGEGVHPLLQLDVVGAEVEARRGRDGSGVAHPSEATDGFTGRDGRSATGRCCRSARVTWKVQDSTSLLSTYHFTTCLPVLAVAMVTNCLFALGRRPGRWRTGAASSPGTSRRPCRSRRACCSRRTPPWSATACTVCVGLRRGLGAARDVRRGSHRPRRPASGGDRRERAGGQRDQRDRDQRARVVMARQPTRGAVSARQPPGPARARRPRRRGRRCSRRPGSGRCRRRRRRRGGPRSARRPPAG